MDTYVIGDKLQSIWGEHNIHTFLETNDLPTITIQRNTGINHVMRFHNNHFMDFVNNIIDFKKYNLPPIEKICDNNKCKYSHENEITPYTIFESEKIFADEVDENKVNRVIEQIIIYMENEITKYNYLPNNFMFIFPILSKNFLANRLESRLQDFWIKKFENKQYQENVLMKNNYWNNKINTNKYYKYVYLHKSDEGKSINLKESENATRILSIHASKGNGCEVVFLLGTSERSLKLFSHDFGNLVYDSLLHVALTRQKNHYMLD
jgi:superfamily I DNA/RNA helicase